MHHTPTAAECRVIREHALKESRRNGNGARTVHIEPGIRYNTDHDRGRSMNIALISDDPDWNDTDLDTTASWSDFRKGFDLSTDGRAIIDFYLYEPRFGDHGDLCCNLQAYFDAEGLHHIAADIEGTRWERYTGWEFNWR